MIKDIRKIMFREKALNNKLSCLNWSAALSKAVTQKL